jgi:hypothetical protein
LLDIFPWKMVDIEYDQARTILQEHFNEVEKLYLAGTLLSPPAQLKKPYAAVFDSNTQAYREVLLGCLLAKLMNPRINIRQPYVDQGDSAFSGRTLDEKVINPFLQSAQIPSSRGPYLSVFRRSVQFDESTRGGLRDKIGYDALLEIFDYVDSGADSRRLSELLTSVLYRLVLLREDSNIQIARLPRASLDQYGALISALLSRPSGGRIPVMLVVSMLRTLAAVYELGWQVEVAGINVADAAAGALGDITVRSSGGVVMALEVTERPVEASRVQSTFRTKIATSGVVDYLFLVDIRRVGPEAIEEARKYFAQGYEVNFVDVNTWLVMSLATLGARGRSVYNTQLTELFGAPDLPKTVKAGWNEEVFKLTGS